MKLQMLRVPKFVYVFLYSLRGGLKAPKAQLVSLEDMGWEEFCWKWVPRFFPQVKLPDSDNYFPPDYQHACIKLLRFALAVSQETATKITTYQNAINPTYAQLLRSKHCLWSIATQYNLPSDFILTISPPHLDLEQFKEASKQVSVEVCHLPSTRPTFPMRASYVTKPKVEVMVS